MYALVMYSNGKLTVSDNMDDGTHEEEKKKKKKLNPSPVNNHLVLDTV